MKAYITSVGERTTDLCIWSLERNGFEVDVIVNKSSLADKLERIYKDAEEDFLRVDADIVVNRNLTPQLLTDLTHDNNAIWWWQFVTYDWFKQDLNHSMAFIRTDALPALRQNIPRFLNDNRPETEASRIHEFYNPRRMATYDKQVMGLHGYAVEDMKPVMKLKASRGQSHLYDFELAAELNKL